jgi:hypothetical protein
VKNHGSYWRGTKNEVNDRYFIDEQFRYIYFLNGALQRWFICWCLLEHTWCPFGIDSVWSTLTVGSYLIGNTNYYISLKLTLITIC